MKTFTFILFLCSILGMTHAQTGFGIRGGLVAGAPVPFPVSNIPTIKGGFPIVFPTIGAFYELELTEEWAVLAEINYVRRGLNYHAQVTDMYYEGPWGSAGSVQAYFTGESRGILDNHYLELPIQAAYQAGEKNRITLGMYIARLIHKDNPVSVRGQISGEPGPKTGDLLVQNYRLDEQINKFDYGWKLGYQRQFSDRIKGEVRVSGGMKSIFQADFKTFPYSVLNLFAETTVSYRLGK